MSHTPDLHEYSARQAIRTLRARVERFFYAEEVPYGLAIVRILLPLVLLWTVIYRWPNTRELYSTDGATAQLALTYGYVDWLPELSGGVMVALHTLLAVTLVSLTCGWCTRASAILSTILYTYINLLDSLSTMTKYSVIASHMLFILSLSPCGLVWSVDSWLKGIGRRRAPWPGEPSRVWPQSAVWPARLMQILIAMVYFGAALTKMHTPAYFSGDQLNFWMLSNVNYYNPFGEWLTLFPAIVIVFGYIAVVWEILFLFLVWRGWGRFSMLLLGTIFHVMTWLTLGLTVFPMVCISCYFAFLTERDVQLAARTLRRGWRRYGRARFARLAPRLPRLPHVEIPTGLRAPSPVVFSVLTLLLVLAGVGIERRMDPYGLRGPNGPLTLRELDPAVVDSMINADSRVREVDKFASFDVGSVLFGGMLINRKREFEHGDRLIAEPGLNVPHEDMWVDCTLNDSQNRVIARLGQPIVREAMRADFFFNIVDAIEPGEYDVVLNSNGQEVARRHITIKGNKRRPPQIASPLAN